MKIGQTPDNSIQVQLGNASGAQKAAQNANASASASAAASTGAAQSTRSAGVAVTVSTLARGLEKSGRNEGADVDAQKVASVRAAIENGSYVVNPEAIADKLLSNAQEMLNRTTS
jgi:negative regulator of flagellin synthesis FlgM